MVMYVLDASPRFNGHGSLTFCKEAMDNAAMRAAAQNVITYPWNSAGSEGFVTASASVRTSTTANQGGAMTAHKTLESSKRAPTQLTSWVLGHRNAATDCEEKHVKTVCGW